MLITLICLRCPFLCEYSSTKVSAPKQNSSHSHSLDTFQRSLKTHMCTIPYPSPLIKICPKSPSLPELPVFFTVPGFLVRVALCLCKKEEASVALSALDTQYWSSHMVPWVVAQGQKVQDNIDHLFLVFCHL